MIVKLILVVCSFFGALMLINGCTSLGSQHAFNLLGVSLSWGLLFALGVAGFAANVKTK